MQPNIYAYRLVSLPQKLLVKMNNYFSHEINLGYIFDWKKQQRTDAYWSRELVFIKKPSRKIFIV